MSVIEEQRMVTWKVISSTLEPCITSLICSMTKLVLRFAGFANQFFPLKLIEIQLIRSKSQKPPLQNFVRYVFFLNRKHAKHATTSYQPPGQYNGSVLALHSLGRQIESPSRPVMLKLFTGRNCCGLGQQWSTTTVRHSPLNKKPRNRVKIRFLTTRYLVTFIMHCKFNLRNLFRSLQTIMPLNYRKQ